MRYSEVVVFLTMKFISCFYNSRAQGVASVAKSPAQTPWRGAQNHENAAASVALA